ncbi:MAG: DMT family transporter [Pseudomonadota bacterium]|nr:DMT family transporter [Pseudomonadota bacterium]
MAKQDGQSDEPRKPHRLAFAGLLVGNAALAFGPWLVRLADTGAVAAGFWRLALAIPLLALLSRAAGQPLRWPGRTLFIAIAVAAFFFAADLAVWHLGIRLTKLGNATLFGNISSFFFAGWGLWLARKLPSPIQGGALLLAAAGSALLMVDSAELSTAHLHGDLLALLAGIFYGFYLILVERARGTVEPLPLLFVATVVGATCLLPFALLLGEQVMPHNWTPLIALAIGSQVIGQGLLVFAIGEVSPLVVGLALLTQPAISMAIGWIGYGEKMSLRDWVGASAIAAALLLVRLRPAVPKPT